MRALRRHWLFGAVFAAGLALRACAAVAYRPALVYIDTVRYLGGDQRGLDPLGYSFLLLRPVLSVHGGLAGVAVAQHLLGLAMGACLYALLVRRGAARWLASLAAAPILLDAYQVQAEQMIMPDVLFEALVVAAIVILLWPAAWPAASQPANQPANHAAQPGLARLAAAAAVLGASATVREVGELLILPLLVYIFAATSGWRPRAVRAAAAAAVFALPVVGYMAISATVLGTGFRLSDMGDAYLYGRLAHAADCATLRVPGYEQSLCPDPATRQTLGVDGLATEAGSPFYRYAPPPGIARSAAISGFDSAVLTQQPLRVAGDIARDAVKLFALTRDTARGDTPVSRWQFQATYPVYRAADSAVLGPSVPRAVTPLARALRAYQLGGGFTPGPLLLASLIFGTVLALSRSSPSSLRVAGLLLVGLGVTAVLGADLYEFSWRYQLPALVTLPAAGALGATALGRQAATWRQALAGRIRRCTPKQLNPRYGRSPAASSTPTPGSGSARTKSSAATAHAEHTRL